MKYIPLIWNGMLRRRARTALTLLSITVAFLLFGLLQSVHQAFMGGARDAAADSMITNSKYSITDTLPVAYQRQIARVPGVGAVAFATWFGGSYSDRPAQFAVYPVVLEEYLQIAPHLQISETTLAAWKATRTSAVVEDTLAERMNWKVGDRVPLQADIWPKADGSLAWTFDLVGTFHNLKEQTGGRGLMLVRHDYFDQTRQFGNGTVGWFQTRVVPSQADRIGKMIDAQFINSDHETKTQTERAFAQSFANQFGDIALMVSAILGAVFFTILVLTGNTMSQSLRERIPELGILKVLGFSDSAVCGLVLSESVLTAVVGAVLGLLLASLMLGGLQSTLSEVGISGMNWPVVLNGIGIAVILGLLVGLPPALKAMRLKIVDALAA